MAGKSRKPAKRYLDLRGQTWWFKQAIPAACRGAFEGKTTYLENLRTSDFRVAQSRRDEVEEAVSERFERARGGGAFRARNTGDANSLATTRGQLWRDTLSGLQETDDERLLGDAEVAADDERESLRGSARRAFEDAFTGRVPVSHHLEAYLSAVRLAPKTTAERRGLVGRFAEWAEGEGLKLDGISRRVAGRYVTDILDPMHPVTAGKHLSALRQYWSFLEARGHVEEGNPWAGQKPKSQGRRATRAQSETERPFEEAEAKALLYSPWPERLDPAHREQLHDALRISLLSGMRMDEVLSLRVEDVVDGHFIIREGKTAAAARRVPIHPDLAGIVARRVAKASSDAQHPSEGKGPKEWLFHELRHERDPSDTFGKRFARYRRKVGVDDKREDKRRSLVNFHSARRWFITQARHAGQPEDVVGDIVGHKRESITFGTYTPGASAAQRRACVESVSLPSP